MTKTILLTGSGGPAGVNVAKSITEGVSKDSDAKDSYKLIGTDINKYHIKFIDELVNKTYIVPRYDQKGYLEAIKKIVDEHNVDLIHAQPDTEVGQHLPNSNPVVSTQLHDLKQYL